MKDTYIDYLKMMEALDSTIKLLETHQNNQKVMSCLQDAQEEIQQAMNYSLSKVI